MSEPYVFQYDTLDGGRKRPLRRGIIVLEMQDGNEKLKLCVHADALAASSGVINRVFEEFVEDMASDDESVCTIKEKSCFPIPSFPPAILDEFLCNVYGKTYEHPHIPRDRRDAEDELSDMESRMEPVLAAIDMTVFFDATDPHFARLDAALYDIIRVSGVAFKRTQDIDIDILLRIEPLATRLPESWAQALKNVVSCANNVSLASLTMDPAAATTFPAEVVMHPTFKLLRDSTREKIAWALLRCQHKAWHINSQKRRTATHTIITEIASELVPRFAEGSHEFKVSGSLPISVSHSAHPKTFIQLIVERTTSCTGGGCIRTYANLSNQCVCRVHADLTLTYRDGSTEKIKTPRAGVERCKRFNTTKNSFDVVSATGTIRIDYCES